MFDDLLLLADGKVIYQGECDKAIKYFDKLGFMCPQYTNPADFLFMTILNNEDDSQEEDKKETNKQRINRLLDTWKSSEENAQVVEAVNNPQTGGIPSRSQKEKAPFFTQYAYLASRASKNAFRNPLIVTTL